jgi:FkbM family methyltransferase
VLRKLQPSKIRRAIGRRWFEAAMARIPSRDDGLAIMSLGTAYGRWAVPDGLIGDDWLCYCVGVGRDISFDLELIRRYRATVRAIEPVPAYCLEASKAAEGVDAFSVRQAALTTQDGPLQMQVTHDPTSASVSSAGLYESRAYVTVPGRTLASLMRETGDERIDLLKIDVEGAEYDLLPALPLRAYGVKILAIQLHHNRGLAEAKRLLAHLDEQGYEQIACLAPVRLTFMAKELRGAPASNR